MLYWINYIFIFHIILDGEKMEKTKNIFEKAIEEQGTLFKEPEVFTLEYIPETLKFRDKEILSMIAYSKALHSKNAPSNMEITGPPATGKTTIIKKYLEIIEGKFDVVTAYINCGFEKTENQILIKIYNEIHNKKIKSGIGNHLLKNKIMSYLGETGKILVVCFDDYGSNKISNKDIDELNKIMYTLLRGHETNPMIKTAVITVTNRKYINFVLSQSVETMFNPVYINFDPYELDEIFNILKNRCDIGFAKGVISEDVIHDIAEYTYQKSDLRIGIRCLSDAGRNAELLGSSTIERKHLNFQNSAF